MIAFSPHGDTHYVNVVYENYNSLTSCSMLTIVVSESLTKLKHAHQRSSRLVSETAQQSLLLQGIPGLVTICCNWPC